MDEAPCHDLTYTSVHTPERSYALVLSQTLRMQDSLSNIYRNWPDALSVQESLREGFSKSSDP